jgi:hypothetical protein
VKTLATFLILFIGLNLSASGLGAGLCTGQSDCLHCSFQHASRSEEMPMGHGCCTTSTATACDFEKSNQTQRSVVYLIPVQVTSPVFTAITYPVPDMPFDIDLKNRPLLPQRKISIQKTPLFIQHLSLIC